MLTLYINPRANKYQSSSLSSSEKNKQIVEIKLNTKTTQSKRRTEKREKDQGTQRQVKNRK